MEIIDRRNIALGGQAKNRSNLDIFSIGVHYTAVLSFIRNHENYWRDFRKWDCGGYLVYIDRQGRIYQNYDYERVSYGATRWNNSTAHVSIETRNKHDYTEAQLEALDYVLHKILKDCPNTSPDRIFGHWEMTNTTACPGWNKAELNSLRARIKRSQSLVSLPVETSSTPKKTLNEVAREVINGVWGNGGKRREKLQKAGYSPSDVQSE